MIRYMGLDVGDRTIGVAVSDLLGLTAQSLKTIKRASLDKDLEELKSIIEEKSVTVLVIGIPKNMNGSIGSQGEKVIGFSNYLKKRLKVEIVHWDERLTSKFADNLMLEGDVKRKKRKEKIDMMAAQNILQSYMDSKNI
ncbi:putative holliday junction resolvase [Alkalibacter saccharofermentans DSM 14828]|uniref:Putative pre-16S rRNA nuclease n=1 Tax=Alkalibacter saccharofermentans DSM 14828 TaxID=1120975 RepID=A0A1M4S7R0_9FIRM|nr:Holliday junction resolvase RuvX [Alkalibacter saccharofermentans]SHE28218.1 putative holliday junction resolvase [Alkalibacter saccharofermentans DSM 14828]